LRVVGLSSAEWAGRYLFHELSLAQVGLTDVIFERDPLEDARFSLAGTLGVARKYGRIPAAQAFCGFSRGFGEAWTRAFDKRSAPTIQDIQRANVQIHRVSEARAPECLQLLVKLEPDIVVICGTAILPECLLQAAKICTLNIHTSVLPHYRGGGSLFWPLFFKDTEPVGFTIHQVIAKVDAGPYLAREHIEVEKKDTPKSLLRKCFAAAAPRMANILRDFQTGKEPQWKWPESRVDFAWRSPGRHFRKYLASRHVEDKFTGAKAVVRKFRSASPKGDGLAIFYLHRILEPATPSSDWRRILGHPDAREIQQRLKYLKQNFELISLSDALKLLSEGKRLAGRFAVLTVDDGYKDFATGLAPILEAENVPATLFVCSGAIEQGTIWYQQLYNLIEGVKSDRLKVPFADRELYFGDVRHRILTIEKFLAAHFKRLKFPVARARLADLLEANPVAHADPVDAFCSVDDLIALKKLPFVELHLHSHFHHPFEKYSAEEAVDDLSRCTEFFRHRLGLETRVLCYPNGDSREELVPSLKACGVEWALSTRVGTERGGDYNPFFLKRIGLDNAPLDYFKRAVSLQLRQT